MECKLLPLCPEDLKLFKKDMQEAFQKGAEAEFEDLNEEILPETDINQSLMKKGAVAYKAVVDGQMVGGAIIVVDETTQHNELDFLYVKYGTQSRGIGRAIWGAIEEKHPHTKVWKTSTPYFEKRNIHFYINSCGFSAVEFFNPHHTDPVLFGDMEAFRFEKVMKR